MRTQMKRIRSSANMIGLTLMSETAFSSVLLTPLMMLVGLLPVYGRTMAELCDIAAYLLVFAAPFLLMAKADGMSLREMAGTGRPAKSVYVTAVFLALGLSTAGGYLGGWLDLLLGGAGIREPVQSYALPDSVPALLLHILSIAVLPPLLEELCYRGFYFRVAERTAGTWPAVWITALLFWAAHSSLTIAPLALGFGLMGGIFRRRYDSILPSMVGHIAVNSIYIVLNAAERVLPYTAYAFIASGETWLSLVLGAVGLARLHAECGSWSGLLPNAAPETKAPVARAYLTSIPMLIALAFSVYYTIQNLEFIA